MSDLQTALEAFRPQIAARYEGFVRGRFAAMLADHPGLKGVGNSYHYGRTWYHTISQYVDMNWKRIDNQNVSDPKINDADLAQGAAKYAEAVTTAWQAKIEQKLGELENATVQRMADVSFTITGTKNGHKVVITQSMIVNVSSKGTMFNQFPALIYVDGKKISEAAYKRLG